MQTLSFPLTPCSDISGHRFLVQRKCWNSLSINGDVQWWLPILLFFFSFRNHVSISHPSELQVVPNYAFSWNVDAEKVSSSRSSVRIEHYWERTSLWTGTCPKVETHEGVIMKQRHKFLGYLSLRQNGQNECMCPLLQFPYQGNSHQKWKPAPI